MTSTRIFKGTTCLRIIKFRSNHRIKTLLCNNLASTKSSLRFSQSCLQSRWSSAPSSTTPRANTSASNNLSSKDLAQRVRTCMRQVPHPIVVVTASAPKSGTSNVQIVCFSIQRPIHSLISLVEAGT